MGSCGVFPATFQSQGSTLAWGMGDNVSIFVSPKCKALMNVGIVGTGNLGPALIEGIYSTDYHDVSVFGYNRTRKKIARLGRKYPRLRICNKVETVVIRSQVLIFAVPFSFIQELSDSVIATIRRKQPLILALCGYVPIRLLQHYFPTKVAKAYPNINWAVGKGVMLIHFGSQFNIKDKKCILSILTRVGDVYEVSEDQFRPYCNLMSCGPALWMRLIDLFVAANVGEYNIDPKLGMEMAQKTIEGTFRLMKEKNYSIEKVIGKVAGRGGTTEAGLKCFEKFLPEIFADTVEQIAWRDSERINRLGRKWPDNSKLDKLPKWKNSNVTN